MASKSPGPMRLGCAASPRVGMADIITDMSCWVSSWSATWVATTCSSSLRRCCWLNRAQRCVCSTIVGCLVCCLAGGALGAAPRHLAVYMCRRARQHFDQGCCIQARTGVSPMSSWGVAGCKNTRHPIESRSDEYLTPYIDPCYLVATDDETAPSASSWCSRDVKKRSIGVDRCCC